MASASASLERIEGELVKESGLFKKWDKKYCKIDGQVLLISEKKGDKPSEEIDLHNSPASFAEAKNQTWVFKIECPKNHTVLFVAPDETTRRKWVAGINHAAFLSNPPGVVKMGYCLKRGGSNSNYKRRWIVLSRREIQYFEDPDSNKPKGAINLLRAESCESARQGKENLIKIAAKDGETNLSRVYVLNVSTPEEMSEWHLAISKAMARNLRCAEVLQRAWRLHKHLKNMHNAWVSYKANALKLKAIVWKLWKNHKLNKDIKAMEKRGASAAEIAEEKLRAKFDMQEKAEKMKAEANKLISSQSKDKDGASGGMKLYFRQTATKVETNLDPNGLIRKFQNRYLVLDQRVVKIYKDRDQFDAATAAGEAGQQPERLFTLIGCDPPKDNEADLTITVQSRKESLKFQLATMAEFKDWLHVMKHSLEMINSMSGFVDDERVMDAEFAQYKEIDTSKFEKRRGFVDVQDGKKDRDRYLAAVSNQGRVYFIRQSRKSDPKVVNLVYSRIEPARLAPDARSFNLIKLEFEEGLLKSDDAPPVERPFCFTFERAVDCKKWHDWIATAQEKTFERCRTAGNCLVNADLLVAFRTWSSLARFKKGCDWYMPANYDLFLPRNRFQPVDSKSFKTNPKQNPVRIRQVPVNSGLGLSNTSSLTADICIEVSPVSNLTSSGSAQKMQLSSIAESVAHMLLCSTLAAPSADRDSKESAILHYEIITSSELDKTFQLSKGLATWTCWKLLARPSGASAECPELAVIVARRSNLPPVGKTFQDVIITVSSAPSSKDGSTSHALDVAEDVCQRISKDKEQVNNPYNAESALNQPAKSRFSVYGREAAQKHVANGSDYEVPQVIRELLGFTLPESAVPWAMASFSVPCMESVMSVIADIVADVQLILSVGAKDAEVEAIDLNQHIRTIIELLEREVTNLNELENGPSATPKGKEAAGASANRFALPPTILRNVTRVVSYYLDGVIDPSVTIFKIISSITNPDLTKLQRSRMLQLLDTMIGLELPASIPIPSGEQSGTICFVRKLLTLIESGKHTDIPALAELAINERVVSSVMGSSFFELALNMLPTAQQKVFRTPDVAARVASQDSYSNSFERLESMFAYCLAKNLLTSVTKKQLQKKRKPRVPAAAVVAPAQPSDEEKAEASESGVGVSDSGSSEKPADAPDAEKESSSPAESTPAPAPAAPAPEEEFEFSRNYSLVTAFYLLILRRAQTGNVLFTQTCVEIARHSDDPHFVSCFLAQDGLVVLENAMKGPAFEPLNARRALLSALLTLTSQSVVIRRKVAVSGIPAILIRVISAGASVPLDAIRLTSAILKNITQCQGDEVAAKALVSLQILQFLTAQAVATCHSLTSSTRDVICGNYLSAIWGLASSNTGRQALKDYYQLPQKLCSVLCEQTICKSDALMDRACGAFMAALLSRPDGAAELMNGHYGDTLMDSILFTLGASEIPKTVQSICGLLRLLTKLPSSAVAKASGRIANCMKAVAKFRTIPLIYELVKHISKQVGENSSYVEKEDGFTSGDGGDDLGGEEQA